MDDTIGFIASGIEIQNMVEELFPEDIKNNKIIIELLNEEELEHQGKKLEQKGAKAIIGRSGGYIYSLDSVEIPVINLEMTTIDILTAIKKASTYNKKIVLVLSHVDYFDYEEWKDIINPYMIVEKFSHKGEIKDIIKKYENQRENFVIVGGGIPCKYAQEYSLDKVFIGATKDSIRQGVHYAKKLLQDIHEQKYKSQILNNVLDQGNDSVIATDNQGKIIFFNKKAQEILDKKLEEVMGKSLVKVCPELEFIFAGKSKDIKIKSRIITLGNYIISVDVSIICVEDQSQGFLCTFQDITKLQNLEKKIRYKLSKKGLTAKYHFNDIIAHSPLMIHTVNKAKKVGLHDNTVVIYGESGTGKEMIAQSLHNISFRKTSPFVAVNCAALSESLLESELFGYEEGAFTGARKGGKPGLFELAHGGTIFLDELNSVSLHLQSKLLRVIEEKEIMRIGSDYVIPLDVRIISAANEELRKKVDEGKFRRDLFYRLNTIELLIPALRDRKEDIIPLFLHYLRADSKELKVTKDIEERLINHKWLGNVRELKNVVERYIIFGELDLDIEEEIIKEKHKVNIESIDLKEINRLVEENIINMLLNNGMTKTEIAKILGISRTALWNKTNKQSQ